MEQKLKDFIAEVGENKGWKVDIGETIVNTVDVTFQRYSPAGQDFYMNIEMDDNAPDDFLKRLNDYYEDFDPDQEALQWCDEDGHGKNGAPKRLKDIIIDFDSIENDIKELAEEFDNKRHELLQAARHKIKVVVTEYLQRVVEVDAIDTSEACEIVEDMVNEEEIILTADDFTTRKIEPYEEGK